VKPFTLSVVIPSKGRADLVGRAARLFTAPIVAVDESEESEYRRLNPGLKIIAHRGFKWLPQIRQWILDTVKSDVIFQCDDDIKGFCCVVGYRRRRIEDPQTIEAIIRNSASNCLEAGTILFFFQHHPDVRKDNVFRPFVFTKTPVGCAQGYWREAFNKEIRYDSRIKTKANLDIALRVMFKRRIIWCDERFGFRNDSHITLKGGLSTYRTPEMMQEDIAILKRRFGDAINLQQFDEGQRSRYVTQTRVQR
jgi:hypothetical protein